MLIRRPTIIQDFFCRVPFKQVVFVSDPLIGGAHFGQPGPQISRFLLRKRDGNAIGCVNRRRRIDMHNKETGVVIPGQGTSQLPSRLGRFREVRGMDNGTNLEHA